MADADTVTPGIGAFLNTTSRSRAFILRIAFIAATGLLPAPSAHAQTTSGGTPTEDDATPVTPMEDPQLGDHWTYESRDEITGQVKPTFVQAITDATAGSVSLRVTAIDNSNANANYLTFDRSWNLTTSGSWRYAPHDGTGVRTPLAVGKSWPIKSSDINSIAGITWKRSGTAKVIAQEKVTTKAGTFDTFKIETSFQVQSPNDPTKKGQVLQQTWFAPAINHWVRRTYESRLDGRVREKSSAELVDYGRRD